MDRRAKWASIVAISVTLLTGGVAAAVTTGALDTVNDGSVGHVRLVEDATAPAPSNVAPSAPNPAAAAVVASETGERAPHAAGARTPDDTTATPAVPEAASDESKGTEVDQPHAPPPTEPTPPPTVGDPSPTTGGTGCTGSDDGMTEAQKQAREAACQGGHADD